MTLSIDLGATNIRIAEVSGKDVKNEKEIQTPKTKKQILNKLFELIDHYPNNKVICIGLAGFVKNEKILGTPNMSFNNTPLKQILEKKYKAKVYLENDANCAGLAELHYGAGKKLKNFILLTLGTGIGGAVVINKKLYKGSGVAGEFGHIFIRGVQLESLASGPASLKIAKKYGFKNTSSLDLEESAKKGNKKALAVYKEVGEALGEGLLSLAYVLDPEAIILTGGFSRVKFIRNEAIKVLRLKDKIKRDIPVIFAKLKQDAGLIGAAMLVNKL